MHLLNEARHPLLIALAIVLAQDVVAQAIRHVRPERFETPAGTELAMRVVRTEATGLRAADWPQQVEWLFVRLGSGAQQNVADPQPRRAGDPARPLAFRDAGVAVVGLDEGDVVEQVPVEAFRRFLREHVADGAAMAERVVPPAAEDAAGRADPAGARPAAAVRVRVVNSSKALVYVSPPDDRERIQSAMAQSKTGQRVEIRAMADPTMVAPGGDLPVRTYVLGDKLGGARVRATHEASGAVSESVMDSGAIGAIRITAPGVWRLEFQHAVPAPAADKQADWIVYSATMLFEAPAEDAE